MKGRFKLEGRHPDRALGAAWKGRCRDLFLAKALPERNLRFFSYDGAFEFELKAVQVIDLPFC